MLNGDSFKTGQKTTSNSDFINRAAIYFLFFISGISALIYQVSWQRILVLHTGVGIYSVSIIVASFMAGIGIGSYWGGLKSELLSKSRAIKIFGGIEILIGLFGLASCTLYYDILLTEAAHIYTSLWLSIPLHFLSLVIPTTLMGMSLPFLVKAVTGTIDTASRDISWLYGANVLGAALGAFVTPWILMRFIGVEGAVRAAAILNLIIGSTILTLLKWGNPSRIETVFPSLKLSKSQQQPEKNIPKTNEFTHSFRLWIFLYAIGGFCSLALEIVWFRIMDVTLKSNGFTFGTMLGFFLLGLGLGSIHGGRLAKRFKQPLKAFLRVQTLIFIVTAISVLALVLLPADLSVYKDFMAFWYKLGDVDVIYFENKKLLVQLYIILPTFLFGIPTYLMGISFGLLQKGVQNDPETSGKKVGYLQCANIIGNVLGSLSIGLFCFNLIGTSGTIKLILVIGLFFPITGLFYFKRDFSFLGSIVLIIVLTLLLPSNKDFWLRLHGRENGNVIIKEDASAVVAAIEQPQHKNHVISLNGKTHSWIPYGGAHTILGVIAAVIHPKPQNVAAIGMGSGDTAWSLGCRKETESITVFEVSEGDINMLYEIPKIRGSEDLKAILADPRLQIRIADGRNELTRRDETYDIIESDALRPYSAYAGNIYSVEFYRLCAKRLNPGGLMSIWAPTPRIKSSFQSVFPYIVFIEKYSVMVGSLEPFEDDINEWLNRLDQTSVIEYLGSVKTDQIKSVIVDWSESNRFIPKGSSKNNYDLFPWDEFRKPLSEEELLFISNSENK